MLGLGNAVTKQREWSPGSISDLIGWWDFTDVSTMFQERDGTFVTPADSDSDPIGSIKNKAKPDLIVLAGWMHILSEIFFLICFLIEGTSFSIYSFKESVLEILFI